MTEHLPECWAKHHSDPPAWCICDELRACEQRVSGEFLTSAALAVTGMSDPRYAKGYTDALDAGHAHGLWDAEVTSRKQSLSKGLWIGWAIGTLWMVIPLIVLAVTR